MEWEIAETLQALFSILELGKTKEQKNVKKKDLRRRRSALVEWSNHPQIGEFKLYFELLGMARLKI